MAPVARADRASSLGLKRPRRSRYAIAARLVRLRRRGDARSATGRLQDVILARSGAGDGRRGCGVSTANLIASRGASPRGGAGTRLGAPQALLTRDGVSLLERVCRPRAPLASRMRSSCWPTARCSGRERWRRAGALCRQYAAPRNGELGRTRIAQSRRPRQTPCCAGPICVDARTWSAGSTARHARGCRNQGTAIAAASAAVARSCGGARDLRRTRMAER